jgi:hypothetical protein
MFDRPPTPELFLEKKTFFLCVTSQQSLWAFYFAVSMMFIYGCSIDFTASHFLSHP